MMRSVKLKLTDNPELEAIIPPDRVVEIGKDMRLCLYDTQFTLTEDAIEEVIWEAK